MDWGHNKLEGVKSNGWWKRMRLEKWYGYKDIYENNNGFRSYNSNNICADRQCLIHIISNSIDDSDVMGVVVDSEFSHQWLYFQVATPQILYHVFGIFMEALMGVDFLLDVLDMWF